MCRNFAIYVVIIVVLTVFYSYETLDDYITNETLQYFIITLIAYTGAYVVLGIIHICVIYYFISAYIGMEKSCHMLKSSPPPKNYRNIFHYEVANEEYARLRYAFITPKHLPSISETYLRGDFDFSQYLAGALDKTLRKVYNTGAATYITFGLLMMIWLSMLKMNHPSYRVTLTQPLGSHTVSIWSHNDSTCTLHSNGLQLHIRTVGLHR
jgi:hypothetical protein